MEFPKEYFEGEEREGFYITSMMKKAWAAQIEVMEEIKKLCNKHNIQFFADYGTLLGAIRHKGFIPWDDDLDLTMKREDYNKFLSVAHELPEGYRIINMHTEPEFTEMLTRIVNGSEINFEEGHLRKYHGCPYVVGVDIFVMDYVSPSEAEDEMITELIRIVLGPAGYIDTDFISAEEKEAFICQVEGLCNAKIDRTKPIRRQLMMLAERLCMLISEKEAKEITLMIRKTKQESYHMDKACYGESIDMPFENTTIPVPVGYDTILRLKYGPNYMVPKNSKAGHDYPFYKEQEQVVKEKLGFIPE